jgi:hypothetical protein
MIRKNTTEEKDSAIAAIILLLAAYLIFRNRYWVYGALVVSVMAVTSTQFTHHLHKIWTLCTDMLGRLSGGVILTLVFIFVLTPTAILRRWFGKKEVILNKKNRISTFQNRNHTYTDVDLDNPW